MFITFEGPDGSGKTTQAVQLASRLRLAGKKVKFTYEPGGTTFGNYLSTLMQYNLVTNDEEVSSRVEVLLFNASRAMLVDRVIRPALNKGKMVICDRYTDSTLAYQSDAERLSLADIGFINNFATQNLVPDLTFFMNISAELAIERIGERAGKLQAKLDHFESRGVEFQQRVIEHYLRLASYRPHWFIIDGSQERDVIAADIDKMLEDKLELKRKQAAKKNE